MQSEDKEKLSKEQIEKILAQFVRSPFRSFLATLLECELTAYEIKDFARKWPDRYASAVTQFARLSGFHERLQVDASLSSEIHNLSDSQLLDKLAELEDKLKIMKDTTEDNAKD